MASTQARTKARTQAHRKTRRRAPSAKSGRRQQAGRQPNGAQTAKRAATRYWSGRVTRESRALDLEGGVFTWNDPKRIAASLKRSAEESHRRKAEPYRSALSMLVFTSIAPAAICRRAAAGHWKKQRSSCASNSGARKFCVRYGSSFQGRARLARAILGPARSPSSNVSTSVARRARISRSFRPRVAASPSATASQRISNNSKLA
jgi:Protein of unknown function (DUF3175)